MKTLLAFILLTTSFSLFAAQEEWTEERVVDRIQISAGSSAVYYFSVNEGWGAPSCPKAAHIFIRKNTSTVADGVLSTVLASQSQGIKIKAKGKCTDKNHFELNYIIQYFSEE